MNTKVMKNLSRRLWGCFVSFITSKWDVCVHINLNLILVCDATTHSASPCSQHKTARCQVWPCSAQLCAAAQTPQRQSWAIPISSVLPPLLQPCPTELITRSARWVCWGGVAGAAPSTCAVLSAVPDCRHPSAGAGVVETLLEAVPQPGLSKDLDKWFESYWNHCPQGKKECVLTKAQNPWVCLVLLLLSSHCCCLIHHRHPFLLDQVSAFSSFSSLVNHSMCLPIMMPVFITPIWERNMHERRKRAKIINTFS